MQQPIGIIAGTSFRFSGIMKDQPVQSVPTPFGDADILTLADAVLALRHGKDGAVPAHRVSHAANLRALKDTGARCVIGIQSAGSLKQALPPGSLLVPHDYISLGPAPTLFEDNRDPHIVPAFDAGLRTSLVRVLAARGVSVFEQGIYWQTTGPRFETRAEIHLMAHFADCVGMTAASEATLAQEMGLAYCCISSIDNYAHGLGQPPLTEAMFHEVVRENTRKMETVLQTILENAGDLICLS